MKKILIIVAFLSILSQISLAKEAVSEHSPEILPNNVVLDLAPGEENEQRITLSDQVSTILEVGRYFEKNYPGDFINGDLSEDVRQFFPHLSNQEVYDREELIRDGVKIYRYAKGIYDKIKSKLLTPEAPPLVVAEEDYDIYTPEPYVDAGENKVLIITDIKKVLSYGPDKKDYEAYKARYERKLKEQAQKENPDAFEQLSQVLSKLNWKKLPFYGLVYDYPIIGNKGIGRWDIDSENKELKATLLSDKTSTNNQDQLRTILRVKIPEGYSIPAFNTQYASKPKIDFSGSQNICGHDAFMPIPEREDIYEGQDQIVYKENLAIPVVLKVADSKQPIQLDAKIEFALCSKQAPCRQVSLNPKLSLEAGSGFSSSVSNYVTQNFNYLPATSLEDVEITKAIYDEENKTLKLSILNSGLIGKPDIYINAGAHTRFSRPRIAIDDDKITALFDVSGEYTNLSDREIEVILVKDAYNALRTRIEVSAASIFDFASERLTLGILLMAMLGGFILNFMPCVFPVLSLKLLSVAEFGAQNDKTLKKSFALTALGIYLTFFMLALLLSVIKSLGYAIGWGMQFQNPLFVVFILFVITLFIAQIKGFYTISIPSKLLMVSQKLGDKSAWRHLFTGFLVVLMATPCTAPYLGTTIGFALAGNPIDIFAVLSAVAIGISLPYLLFIFMPDISVFVPKPGSWMEKLEHWMNFLLVLTIIWLLSILWSQTEAWTIFRVVLYLGIFFGLIWFRQHIVDDIEYQETQEYIKKSAQKMIRISFWIIAVLLFIGASWDVKSSFAVARQETSQTTTQQLNLAEIAADVKQGRIVLVNVGASWCLTCTYNDYLVFGNISVKKLINQYNIKVINIDWTNYSTEILQFMERFGRVGIPFSILFSPNIPEGMVLPEIMTERELSDILRSVAQ